MDDRVWVGTCTGPSDVMLVRSLFDAHDIPVVISGEHFCLLHPWYVGAFRTDVFASAGDAADAATLLADSRSGVHTMAGESGIPHRAIENRDRASDVQLIGSPPHPWGSVPTDRRHQAGIALLFGMISGFGAAHFYYTRAWLRGLALALVQLSATRVVGHSLHALGLVILARIVDVVGVLWLLWFGRDEQLASRWRRREAAEQEPGGTSVQGGAPPPGAEPESTDSGVPAGTPPVPFRSSAETHE